MITLKENKVLIDGRPRLIIAGEIHYFRLPVSEWEDRIIKLKETGCNACATYIPWVLHEFYENQFDFGETESFLNLQLFIELCQKHDLYFIARPGPFIMAEMKNEGIPYWLYKNYPQLIPTTWNYEQVSTKTLDYSHPIFLQLAQRWYQKVCSILEPFLHQNGGPIIAFQLDNEIGMLSWVSNSPDLTPYTLTLFSGWLRNTYSALELQKRYGTLLTEHHDLEVDIFKENSERGLLIWKDLGYFMRQRFKDYVATLKLYAQSSGIRGIPFIVNIHGTSQSRGFTFPIGISQLFESFAEDKDILPGTDLYFGNLDMNNFHDLYIVNAYTKSVVRRRQPIGCMEFNCGDGNFGDNYSGRYDVSAADLKLRMMLAQENRLINYYLFTGGYNYPLPKKTGDGNDRSAFTGERHGFGAPITPKGNFNYTYPRLNEATKRMMIFEDKLADMEEELDDVSIAFIPDYFMTEYSLPDNQLVSNMIQNIEGYRCTGMWESTLRSLLLSNFRMDAVNLQAEIDLSSKKCLLLSSASYMDKAIQQKLKKYVQTGGNLLLYGLIPEYDMEGHPCTILKEALQIEQVCLITEQDIPYLSVRHKNWAQTYPEIRTWFVQAYKPKEHHQTFLIEKTNEMVCGSIVSVGSGNAILMTTQYRGDRNFYKELLQQIGIIPTYQHTCHQHGIFLTSSKNDKEEQFLHVINLDGFDKAFEITRKGNVLFDGQSVYLGARRGLLLPCNLQLPFGKLVYATHEVVSYDYSNLTFSGEIFDIWIRLKSNRQIEELSNIEVTYLKNDEILVRILPTLEKEVKICFK